MKVHDVLQDVSKLIGATVTIEGIFVLKGEAAYIVACEDDVDNPYNAIGVKVEELKKRLFSKVPALVGSQFSYCDNAKIVGILALDQSDFSYSLVDIELFEIYKYGETLVAIP